MTGTATDKLTVQQFADFMNTDFMKKNDSARDPPITLEQARIEMVRVTGKEHVTELDVTYFGVWLDDELNSVYPPEKKVR